jgi:demethylmenaquinone methyltransferase/2-methoxy-6-polyprenyl-1,4-benzoquinol methylase
MEDKSLTRQRKIAGMFSSISKKYDFLNTLFSLGIDSSWRRELVKVALQNRPGNILDVASGTGKVAFETLRQKRDSHVFCLDPSMRMLGLAKEGCPDEYRHLLYFVSGTAEALPFSSCSFDAVTVAFGIRNFADLEAGLREIYRVLKPGGVFVVLEFSMPDNFIFKFFYNIYLGYAIPLIGFIFSKSRAYFYLRDTIKKFPRDEKLKKVLEKIGFANVSYQKYTTGVVACYRGEKRSD